MGGDDWGHCKGCPRYLSINSLSAQRKPGLPSVAVSPMSPTSKLHQHYPSPEWLHLLLPLWDTQPPHAQVLDYCLSCHSPWFPTSSVFLWSNSCSSCTFSNHFSWEESPWPRLFLFYHLNLLPLEFIPLYLLFNSLKALQHANFFVIVVYVVSSSSFFLSPQLYTRLTS